MKKALFIVLLLVSPAMAADVAPIQVARLAAPINVPLSPDDIALLQTAVELAPSVCEQNTNACYVGIHKADLEQKVQAALAGSKGGK